MGPPLKGSRRADRLRALNVPLRVEVALDDEGRPAVIGESADPGGRRVAEVLEVWRLDDEWWRAPIARRYVEVVLEGGGHVVVFEDLNSGKWFVQMP